MAMSKRPENGKVRKVTKTSGRKPENPEKNGKVREREARTDRVKRAERKQASELFNNNCFNLFRKLSLEINISTGDTEF